MRLELQSDMYGTTIILVALLVLGGWAATYIALRLAMRRKMEDFRRQLRETRDQINALNETITKMRAEVVEPVVVPSASPVDAEPVPESEISPEMLVIIAAAVTTYLGKKVRIRSAQLLQTPYELFNPWAQQGRAVIQASHDLTQRGYRE